MASFAALLTAAPLSAQVSQAGKSVLDGVLGTLDSKRDHYADVAKQIWGFAELGYQEQKSSALLQSELTNAGFTVKSGVADIPTAFVASYGSGKPIIAIVGEFDALPGLSQAAVPTRQPIATSIAGHALRASSIRHGLNRGGDRREAVARVAAQDRHDSLLRNAGRRRWIGQGVHGACRDCSTTSTPSSPGTRAIATTFRR